MVFFAPQEQAVRLAEGNSEMTTRSGAWGWTGCLEPSTVSSTGVALEQFLSDYLEMFKLPRVFHAVKMQMY